MELTWLEITINTTADDLDTLAAKLTANGVVGLVIEDEADFKEFLEKNRQYWDYVDDELLHRMEGAARVKFYVTDDADGQKQLQQYTAGLEGYEILSASLKENDWATSWQKYYKPLVAQSFSFSETDRISYPSSPAVYCASCFWPSSSSVT